MYQDISMFSTHFLFERNNIFSFLFPVIYYIKSLKHYLMFSLHEWLNPSISSVIRKATFLHSVVQLFCETDNCFSGFNFHTVLQRWGIVCKYTAVSSNLSSLNQCKIMHNNINNIVYTQLECVCFCCRSLETIQTGQPCSHVLGDFLVFWPQQWILNDWICLLKDHLSLQNFTIVIQYYILSALQCGISQGDSW